MHVEALRAGAINWNGWRRGNPRVVPDLNDLSVLVSERQFGRVQGGPIDLNLAELCRAKLDQATLIEANLQGALLTDADLSDARLEKADLRGANLCNAKLSFAALNGVRLEGANLCGADLRHAKGLTQAQINQALGDSSTALPLSLSMPKAWLQQGPFPAQLGDHCDPVFDHKDDPHAILGVTPLASLREIRAAWLRLVKELHPEGWSSRRSPATQRLKAINQAYQRLKSQHCQAAQARTRRRFFHGAKAVFAVSFLLPILAGALLMGMWSYLASEFAAHVTTSVIGRSAREGASKEPSAPRHISYPGSAQSSSSEPFLGADWRLR
jgi:hypothetical protein